MSSASSCFWTRTNAACHYCSVKDYACRLDLRLTDPKGCRCLLRHYLRHHERLEAKDEELWKNTKIFGAKKRLKMMRNHFLGKINAGCNGLGIGNGFIYNKQKSIWALLLDKGAPDLLLDD